MTGRRTYLDHAATTPLLPAARAAMTAALEAWANPSSPHGEGRRARAALEDARARIAESLAVRADGLVFTSGASEALGLAMARVRRPRRLVSAVEHDAVLRADPAAQRVPVGPDGLIDRDRLAALLDGAPALVAVQHVNNETGVIQPLADVADLVRRGGGVLLVDAAQSAGKLPLPDADLIALSAHKMGGPPGIGALVVRDFDLLEASGGQERGYRGGTENLPAILGWAAALAAAPAWLDRAGALRQRLETALTAAGAEIVATDAPRLATIGAVRMAGVEAATQLIHFDMAGIAVSAGAACSSGSMKPSHVLAAMGMAGGAEREVVRVSFGPDTSEAEVDAFVAAWQTLRERSRRRAA